ncbi:MAG TPA: hypothetical protein VN455_10695 [Methanotrichaceae archaeon]|nr:hypothetical protein [Methanotrichaceae archaeon]
MSNEIRKYRHLSDSNEEDDLILTALAGKDVSIKFTIGSCECTLSQQQLLDLISVIARRSLMRKGFKATEYLPNYLTVTPDGSLLVEREDEPEEMSG